MGFFGLGGEFGSWLDNPQYGWKSGGSSSYARPKSSVSRSAGSSGGWAGSSRSTTHSAGNEDWARIFDQGGGDSGSGGDSGGGGGGGSWGGGGGDRGGLTGGGYGDDPTQWGGDSGHLFALETDKQNFKKQWDDIRKNDAWESDKQRLDYLFEKFGFKPGGDNSTGRLPPEWGGGPSQTPGAWQRPADWNPEQAGAPESKIDTLEVIKSHKPRIMEDMNRAMAAAAMKQGSTGALMGSGYTQALGGAARKAAGDIGQITMDTLFKAGEEQANRDLTAQQNALDRSFQGWQDQGNWGLDAWGQKGAWDQEANQNDLNRSLDAWGQHGDWQMQNNQDQQRYMMELLGMMGGFMGGGGPGNYQNMTDYDFTGLR